jgi:hypothetical protein
VHQNKQGTHRKITSDFDLKEGGTDFYLEKSAPAS